MKGAPCRNRCGRRTWPGNGARGLCNRCYKRERYREGPHVERTVLCGCNCGTPFTTTCATRLYVNSTHAARVHRRKRARQRAAAPFPRGAFTFLAKELRAEMDAEGKAGLCLYCEGRLPGRRKYYCLSPQCEHLYVADWKRSRTLLERQAKQATIHDSGAS